MQLNEVMILKAGNQRKRVQYSSLFSYTNVLSATQRADEGKFFLEEPQLVNEDRTSLFAISNQWMELTIITAPPDITCLWIEHYTTTYETVLPKKKKEKSKCESDQASRCDDS